MDFQKYNVTKSAENETKKITSTNKTHPKNSPEQVGWGVCNE